MPQQQTAPARTAGTELPQDIARHEPVIEESRAKRLYFIIGIAVAVLLIGYAIYAVITSGKVTTDDAQVAADVVPIAARVAGQITNVYIHENQFVHRGDPIGGDSLFNGDNETVVFVLPRTTYSDGALDMFAKGVITEANALLAAADDALS